ncbi:hypothetical protein QFC21_003182 [Naganishia friedmannii]|uniref:Uncharacterized protein n=1 Tax=Naganishia friedmannii TaxID=89922 RepID=A0ACC2VR89_9TREE|nr:hypothetical protein QFC21_003182 [Naganishia friedmannii]
MYNVVVVDTKLDQADKASASPKVSSIFNDPTASAVFKTSDGTTFRVHDFFLKANSGVFRDMLSSSTPSSSNDHPISLDEDCDDFNIMLLIITGRPYDAIHETQSWKQAARLYRMMDKYQLDGHQPWFSEMCGLWVNVNPLEALFLAYNRPCIDTILARYAIADGIANMSAEALDIVGERYFLNIWLPGKSNISLAPSNMTVKFGLRLGFKRLLAYCLTFANLQKNAAPDWNALAVRFVANARLIEREINPSPPKS